MLPCHKTAERTSSIAATPANELNIILSAPLASFGATGEFEFAPVACIGVVWPDDAVDVLWSTVPVDVMVGALMLGPVT
jgi:hypothetical protein